MFLSLDISTALSVEQVKRHPNSSQRNFNKSHWRKGTKLSRKGVVFFASFKKHEHSLDGWECPFFSVSQFWMPHIHYKYESESALFSFLPPNFVFEGIIKYDELSLLPRPAKVMLGDLKLCPNWSKRSGVKLSSKAVSHLQIWFLQPHSCAWSQVWRFFVLLIMTQKSKYLDSLATRIFGPSGITRPRWDRMRQLVGPQWGHTCIPGCITENLTWKQLRGSKMCSCSFGPEPSCSHWAFWFCHEIQRDRIPRKVKFFHQKKKSHGDFENIPLHRPGLFCNPLHRRSFPAGHTFLGLYHSFAEISDLKDAN